MQNESSERRCQLTRLDGVCLLLLIAYFLYFALPARHGGFREDEMMNLWTYWHLGPLQCLLGLAKFWTSYYRPGGALYYLPLYHFFWLNPLPYRIVQISILILSIPLGYYLARLLASSRSVAFLAMLAVCYHPHVANLIFVGAFIYDVLCGFFYLSALTYYVYFRKRDIYLRPTQVLIFLLLFVLALDSKEMAVTLPAVVLVYEVLKSSRWASWNAFLSWSWRCAAPSLIAGVVAAIYIMGKLYDSRSLTRLDPYRPRYSWHQFLVSNAHFLGDLFFVQSLITPATVLMLWATVCIYAVLRRERLVQLMAFWVMVVPLPIAFLLPIRGGGCLYLLLFGWAILLAKVASDLALLISKAAAPFGNWVSTRIHAVNANRNGNATRRLSIASILRVAQMKISPSTIRIGVIATVAVCLGIFTAYQNRRLGTERALLGVGEKVNHVIATIESLNLQPAPHSTVLLKVDDHLFRNKWHALFIASLVWNDHSVQIGIDKLNKLTPEQLAKVDYIISLTESEATIIRSPNVHDSE